MAGDEGDVDEDAWLTQLRAALAETTEHRDGARTLPEGPITIPLDEPDAGSIDPWREAVSDRSEDPAVDQSSEAPPGASVDTSALEAQIERLVERVDALTARVEESLAGPTDDGMNRSAAHIALLVNELHERLASFEATQTALLEASVEERRRVVDEAVSEIRKLLFG